MGKLLSTESVTITVVVEARIPSSFSLWECQHKLLNNETEVKIQIGNQEFTEKEWDKLMERIDKDLDDIQEALKEKEEKQAEEEYEDKIQELFDERKELA